MRVAYVPLDSRPLNWQFPQQLAQLCGIKLVMPPREWLGTLRSGADGVRLTRWLAETANSCEAAVFAWDALIYGGLIQSRQPEIPHNRPDDIARILSGVDWSTVAGYAFSVVPRLGLSVTNDTELQSHETVREYFELTGKPNTEPRRAQLEERLGSKMVEKLWVWRGRNQNHNKTIARLAHDLPLRHQHFAVEDNAPTGPHLAEVKELRKLAADYSAFPSSQLTFFDGTDEMGCVLLAMAWREFRKAPKLPLRVMLHPRVPGAGRYYGRYESYSLGQGLVILSELLGLEFSHDEGRASWLITYGVQPQPDAFSGDAEQMFNNPYLLPAELPRGLPIFATDLAACNAANPHLARLLLEDAGGLLLGLVGTNTNFNALGVSASLLTASQDDLEAAGLTEFLVARLADDVVYQGIARQRVREYLGHKGLSAANFSEAGYMVEEDCLNIVRSSWMNWLENEGTSLLLGAGINPKYAKALDFRFPWGRAFEIEVIPPG